MDEIRNAAGKLVCRIDAQNRTVEIIQKHHVTLITFNLDKTITVSNQVMK